MRLNLRTVIHTRIQAPTMITIITITIIMTMTMTTIATMATMVIPIVCLRFIMMRYTTTIRKVFMDLYQSVQPSRRILAPIKCT